MASPKPSLFMFFLGEVRNFPFSLVKPTHVVTSSAGPDSGVAFVVTSPLTVGCGVQRDGCIDDVALDAHHFVVGVDASVMPLHEVAVCSVGDSEVIAEAGRSQFNISVNLNSSICPQRQAQSAPVIRPRRHLAAEPVVEAAHVPDSPQPPRATTFVMPLVSIATSIVIAVARAHGCSSSLVQQLQ